MIYLATLVVSARITPMPWVPSRSLMMTGGPPIRSMVGTTSSDLVVPVSTLLRQLDTASIHLSFGYQALEAVPVGMFRITHV